MSQEERRGTGIAGAMDYQPTGHNGPVCIACGAPISGNTPGKPAARIKLGVGVIHACSRECAADPRFTLQEGK